jgi:hypothetical protein
VPLNPQIGSQWMLRGQQAQARKQDLVVRTADGTEFMVTVVDEFDEETARTQQNAKLMAMLDERAEQAQTVPLAQVTRQRGLSE